MWGEGGRDIIKSIRSSSEASIRWWKDREIVQGKVSTGEIKDRSATRCPSSWSNRHGRQFFPSGPNPIIIPIVRRRLYSLLYQLLLFLSFIRIYFLCRIYDLSFEFLNRPFRFEYIRRRKIRSIRVRRQRKELLHIQTESAAVRGRACLKVNSYPATALKRIIRKRDKLRERASIETHGKNIAASMEIASKLRN